jgi:hypothetical protein
VQASRTQESTGQPVGRGRRDDPLRRIALIATAVAVPVLVALVVLVRVLGADTGTSHAAGSGSVADVQGAPSSPRADTSPLPVQVPPVTPEADARCPALMSNLPLSLAGAQARPVQSDSPYAYAWGDPALVLICGVGRPARFDPTAQIIQIQGVQWFVDDSDPQVNVWTAVDRPVYVQVSIPSSIDSAPVTVLSPIVAATLPFQAPQPG